MNWNEVGCLVIAAALSMGSPAHGQSWVASLNASMRSEVRRSSNCPGLAARNLAMLHIAIHDGFFAGYTDEQFFGYPETTASLTDAQRATAAYIAGSSVLKALYPGAVSPENFIKHESDESSRSIGLSIAEMVLQERADDGSARNLTYLPENKPGKWRRTASRRPPEHPEWAFVKPFFIDDIRALRPPPPPDVESGTFKMALEEVLRIGGLTSIERNKEQTKIAHFWSAFSYTETPVGMWNAIAISLLDGIGANTQRQAEVLLALNVVIADTLVACWDTKFHYGFWRPEHAIHHRHNDLSWSPLLEAPPHPEYVSGHSAVSGAAAHLLRGEIGELASDFTVNSSVDSSVRHFRTVEEAALEASVSRIFGGIHFRFSCDEGLELGREVANQWFSQR